MFNRRKFLQRTFFSSLTAGLGLASCDNSAAATRISNPHSRSSLPIAIATWNPNVKATQAAWNVLADGGRAIDAVEAGARVPEADPEDTSVGYGGLPDLNGIVTLDACIMDERGKAGSVTFVQHMLQPVSVARKVMEETPHVMLSGEGALQFALGHGFEKQELLTEKAKESWNKWKANNYDGPRVSPEQHDTIGILAIDQHGDISGACTTSGAAFKMHGRVGDSPILGAGMYVDNEVGGACSTGWGELVMKTLGSFLIVELMRQGMTPQEACEEAVRRIVTRYPDELKDDFGVGYVAINKQGEHGAFSVGKGLSYAICQDGENRYHEAKSHFPGEK